MIIYIYIVQTAGRKNVIPVGCSELPAAWTCVWAVWEERRGQVKYSLCPACQVGHDALHLPECVPTEYGPLCKEAQLPLRITSKKTPSTFLQIIIMDNKWLNLKSRKALVKTGSTGTVVIYIKEWHIGMYSVQFNTAK